jgi:sensor c-di-GMP phosphodiesterase-like protein
VSGVCLYGLLHQLGVRLAQGHHFGKAAPLQAPAAAGPPAT